MTWTAPMTFVDGYALTASQLNTHLRDNLLSCSTAKATTITGYFISTAKHKIVERIPGFARIDADETTTSTDYADLTTSGPSVTVTTGNAALVFSTMKLYINTANAAVGAAWQISGATERDADDRNQVKIDGLAATTQGTRIGIMDLITDLEPGVNTFTMKYKVGSGTGGFDTRVLIVLPL